MRNFYQGNTFYSHVRPSSELDCNFKKIKEMGMDIVRTAEIWPGWSVIEHTEGEYDYEILDDYVEKAIKNGLKICMGVGVNDTPFWLYEKFSDLRCIDVNGKKAVRHVHSACIDHELYRKHMDKFIVDFTTHYTKVDQIVAWQFGNEVRYGVNICDCPSTRTRFREWLKQKYKDINVINSEWGVCYHGWNEIYPYCSYDGAPTEGIAPHAIDTMAFQNWSLEEFIHHGIEIMKKNTNKPIFHNNFNLSHNSGSHWNLSKPCDYSTIDVYGVTYDKPGYYSGLLIDIASSIAFQQKKPLWVTETCAGQYGTYERIPVSPKLIDCFSMDYIGAGAEAILYFRQKAPIWEQPHKFTGSQTFLRIDDSELEYANTPRKIASFMKTHSDDILNSQPVQSQVGVYYPGESLVFSKFAGYEKIARDSLFGARAIWAGVQLPVEFLDTDTICNYDLSRFKVIYLPTAFLLPDSVGKALEVYVRNGGVLISEGRPGYVNERGLLYEIQPGAGLNKVFGAREDLYYNISEAQINISLNENKINVKLPGYIQTYRLFGGSPIAWDKDGKICGVMNKYGKGTAYILGTAPSLLFNPGIGKYDIDDLSEAYDNKMINEMCNFMELIATTHGVVKPLDIICKEPQVTVRYMHNSQNGDDIVFCINYNSKSEANILVGSKMKKIFLLENTISTFTSERKFTIAPLSYVVLKLTI